MHQRIAELREQILDLCRAHGVQRLELFGSAARADFDPRHSDADFLVEFADHGPGTMADRYLGLLHGLEDLLGLHVDLVMTRAVENPYFFEAIGADRTLLYAA